MSRDAPWMKFYPADWRANRHLRVCSLAARGLWMEILCLMHEATPYGHLLLNGHPVTNAQLAALAGTSSEQISELLGELESAGVFSLTNKGVIYSRRMSRDEKKAKTAKKNGKNGGNPSLCKTKQISAPDNPQDKAEDKAQKPEARSQIDTDDKSASASERVLACIGALDDPNLRVHAGRLTAWLSSGADLELDILQTLPVVLAKARQRRGPGWMPTSLNYFDGAVADAVARRTKPLPEPKEQSHGNRNRSPQRRSFDDEMRAIDAAVASSRSGGLASGTGGAEDADGTVIDVEFEHV